MTALLFNVPVIVSGAGWAVPVAFLVAAAMLAVFSVGYVIIGVFAYFAASTIADWLGVNVPVWVLLFGALAVNGFVLDDSSRDAALLKLATWSPLLGLLVIQALTSVAIVAYFRCHPGGGVWSTLVAPLVGGALMAFSAYLLIDNRGSLAAAAGVPFVEAIPWIVLAVFALGAIGLRPWNARVPQNVPAYES
jgi:hypothetical protein